MVETSQFNLPLLAASQAQKNVTVNEALSILDAVAQLRIQSATISSPPTSHVDGDAYFVPPGALGDWFGQDGQLAISANGGWRFVLPKAGWHAVNLETGTSQMFDGTVWLDSSLAATPSGTATEYKILEIDHTVMLAGTSVTPAFIPANSQVVGVTGRVTEALTGTFSTWSLGADGSPDRYGSDLGKDINSYVVGLTGTPITYYNDTALELTATGGDFAGGRVLLAVHYMSLVPPRAV